MAGTRTAPDASVANPNKIITTLHVIDQSGDKFADAIVTPTSPTLAQVEAWAAAYQAATQASLYEITQLLSWNGAAASSNAQTGSRDSVAEGINFLLKDPTNLKSQTPRLVAPLAAVMQGTQDVPLLTATEATNLTTALLNILTSYAFSHAQFTGHRERANNPRITS